MVRDDSERGRMEVRYADGLVNATLYSKKYSGPI
jgi:hypothetical protein